MEIITKNEMVEELANRLVKLKGRSVVINTSGGFFIEQKLTITEIEFNKDIHSISVKNDLNNDIQISSQELENVIYNCPDTTAKIVLDYGNHFMHIFV